MNKKVVFLTVTITLVIFIIIALIMTISKRISNKKTNMPSQVATSKKIDTKLNTGGTVSPQPSASNYQAPPAGSTKPINDLSDWKTYKNQAIGFELKYPPMFKLTEDSSIPDNFQLYISPINDPQSDNWRIEIQKADSENFLGTCSEYIAKPNPLNPLVKIGDTIIGGLSGKKVETSYKDTFFNTVCIDRKNITYQFICTSRVPGKTTDIHDYTLFNKMISSVTFY